MKKKAFIFFAVILVVSSASFVSCGGDDDDSRPTVTNLEPESGDKVQIGKAIHFEAKIADEAGLVRYSIEIHNDFDGHGHKAAASDSIAWAYTSPQWTTDVGGASLDGLKEALLHHHEIVIPKEFNGKPVREGNYHFLLLVYNKQGRYTAVARDIILTYNEVGTED